MDPATTEEHSQLEAQISPPATEKGPAEGQPSPATSPLPGEQSAPKIPEMISPESSSPAVSAPEKKQFDLQAPPERPPVSAPPTEGQKDWGKIDISPPKESPVEGAGKVVQSAEPAVRAETQLREQAQERRFEQIRELIDQLDQNIARLNEIVQDLKAKSSVEGSQNLPERPSRPPK